MPRLNDYAVDDNVAGLLYGPAGSGKTSIIGSLGSRNLIIDTGLGVARTLKAPDFKYRYPNCNPIIEDIYEELLPDKATAHDRVCDILDAYLDPKHPMFNEFDSVCIDDATALKRGAQNLALEINDGLGKSESLKKSRKVGQMIHTVQDYGQEIEIIDKFITDYITICKSRGKNFFIVAHERLTYGKAEKGNPPPLLKTRPGFTGQTFPDQVQGHFDFTWYLERQGGGDRILYYARTSGDSTLDAKTRGGGSDGKSMLFPVRWQNPDLTRAIEAFRTGKSVITVK